MSLTKTTWEDLARLGWPIYEVYKKANAQRGGTMKGTGDIFLNSGIAADYQWWYYNVTIGSPYILGQRPFDPVVQEQTAWSYDNTQNSKPFETTWHEDWTDTVSATLTTTTSASISLNASVTIFDVASTGFDITISTESSQAQTKERTHNLSQDWPMDVGPHKKLTLTRIITTTGQLVTYGQAFGLRDGSLLGTKGDKYNDHYYWGMYVNTLCNSPKGVLELQGSSRITTYSFKLVREGPKGREETPLPQMMARVLGRKPELKQMIAGPE